METTIKTVTYIKYYVTSLNFATLTIHVYELEMPVEERNPSEHARNTHPSFFAFSYYDVDEVVVDTGDDEEVRATSKPREVSGSYYLDGRVLSRYAVITQLGNSSSVLRDMELGGHKFVVLCRNGEMYPFDTERDAVIASS